MICVKTVKNRLCHEHHFQWHPMNLWFKGGTLMWIFQWVRWKYPCSPSMNDLPVASFQEIGKNLFFCSSTAVLNLFGPKHYWVILLWISCHVQRHNNEASQVWFPFITYLKVKPSHIFADLSFTQLPFWKWCFGYSMFGWKCRGASVFTQSVFQFSMLTAHLTHLAQTFLSSCFSSSYLNVLSQELQVLTFAFLSSIRVCMVYLYDGGRHRRYKNVFFNIS